MIEVAHTVYKNAMNECSFFLYKCWAFCIINAIFPFLTCLDFGVCRAIRLVRFGYNTFTGCVA